MRQTLPAFLVVALVVGASIACQSPSQPSEPRYEVKPAQIDSLGLVRGLAPSGFGVHVIGVVGDGCSELLPTVQVRNGNVVSLTVQRRRPVDAICTQIAKLFDQVIPLEGAFPPGDYAVRINGTELTFSAP